MMGTEDKSLFCFCHWGRKNKVLPDGSTYVGGITDHIIVKTGIKYNDFVNAVFDRLDIDPSDKSLHFTVKFDGSELIRLRDQEGVDTLLQFNDGCAHVYASSLEKELDSRLPPASVKKSEHIIVSDTEPATLVGDDQNDDKCGVLSKAAVGKAPPHQVNQEPFFRQNNVQNELIRLKDQEGVDTLLQFNGVYASNLEKEPYSRPPSGGAEKVKKVEQITVSDTEPANPVGDDQNDDKCGDLSEAAVAKVPPHQVYQEPFVRQNNVQNGVTAQVSNLNHHKHTQPTMQETFWTQCPSCKIRYQYYSTYVNKVLRCQRCSKTFTAYNFDSRGATSTLKQRELSNHGTSKITAGSAGFPPTQIGSREDEKHEKLMGGMREGAATPKVNPKSRKKSRRQTVELSESDDTSTSVETNDI